MGVIQCPDCKGKVSDALSACPHCGAPVQSTEGSPRRVRTPAMAGTDQSTEVDHATPLASEPEQAGDRKAAGPPLLAGRKRVVAIGSAVAVCALVIVMIALSGDEPGAEAEKTEPGKETELAGDTASAGEVEPAQSEADKLEQAARLYKIANDSTLDDATRTTYFKQACELGHLQACAVYGARLTELEEKHVEAKPILEDACNRGSADACARLGRLYGKGRGVERDDSKAYQLQEKACNDGSDYGCFLFAGRLKKGKGGPKNKAMARRHYKRLCDEGGPVANLACMMLRL